MVARRSPRAVAHKRTTGALYSRVRFGLFPNGGGLTNFAAMESKLGAKFASYVTFQTMGTGGSSNWPTAEANYCKTNGHRLHIAWDVASGGPTFATILAGGNDASLDAFFQAAKTHGDPITLRMWWEMNDSLGPTKPGNQVLVAGTGATARQQWIDAWRYVYNRCWVTNGCTNVQFFYCPNGSDSNSAGNTIENLYPGSAYVDRVGFNTYNETTFASWTEMAAKFTSPYNRVTALHATAPVEVGEFGTVNVDPNNAANTKATWFTNMFLTTALPRLDILNYFGVNQVAEGGNDWSLDATTAATNVWAQYLPLTPGSGPYVAPTPAKIATLVDNFSTNSGLWAGSGYTVSGGVATVPASPAYPSLVSAATYDLTSSQVVVQLVSAPNIGTGSTHAGISVLVDDNNRLAIAWDGGTLAFQEIIGGTVTSGTPIPYSAASHQWWRIRHSGSTVFWETSGDKSTWTVRYQKTTILTLTALKVRLEAGNWNSEASPGSAVYDNVN